MTLTRNCKLGTLPPSAFSRLSQMLDPQDKWKYVAEHIPRRNGGQRFTQDCINTLQWRYRGPGQSPTKEMLCVWKTDNASIGQLLQLLLELKLYREARYIAEEILHEKIVIEDEVLDESPDDPRVCDVIASQQERRLDGQEGGRSVLPTQGHNKGFPPCGISKSSRMGALGNPPGDAKKPGGICNQGGSPILSTAARSPVPVTMETNSPSSCHHQMLKAQEEIQYPSPNVPGASDIRQLDSHLDTEISMDSSTLVPAVDGGSVNVLKPLGVPHPGANTQVYTFVPGVQSYYNITEGITADLSNAPTAPLRHYDNAIQESPEDVDFSFTAGTLKKFSFSSLEYATGMFNEMPLTKGGRLLGQGGSASVFLGKAAEVQVAVKKLVPPRTSHQVQKQFITEVQVLGKCNHENILPLVGYSDDNFQSWCIVYAFMPNGSVEDKLAIKGDDGFDVAQRINTAKGTARGIHYLHTRDPPLIHRDIKSANILLDSDMTPKIGDCGIARLTPLDDVRTSTMTQCVIGTRPYMPPEYIEGSVISFKLDAYSYGVVLLELLTGLPVADDKREDMFLASHVRENCDDFSQFSDMIDRSAGEWEEPTTCAMYNMSMRLLQRKRNRPAISEVLPDIESW